MQDKSVEECWGRAGVIGVRRVRSSLGNIYVGFPSYLVLRTKIIMGMTKKGYSAQYLFGQKRTEQRQVLADTLFWQGPKEYLLPLFSPTFLRTSAPSWLLNFSKATGTDDSRHHVVACTSLHTA